MEDRSSRRMRTLVTQHGPVEACPLNEVARALISMMARSRTLQQKAGYIDARPHTANSTKFSCNARPDHTLGQLGLGPKSRSCPLSPLLRPNRGRRGTSVSGEQRTSPFFAALGGSHGDTTAHPVAIKNKAGCTWERETSLLLRTGVLVCQASKTKRVPVYERNSLVGISALAIS